MQDVLCIAHGTCCTLSEQVLHRAGAVRRGVGRWPKGLEQFVKCHNRYGGIVAAVFNRQACFAFGYLDEHAGLLPEPARLRQGRGRKAKINPVAVEAWQIHVARLAMEKEAKLPPWDKQAVEDGNFLRWLVGLSAIRGNGPRLAREALEEKGIAVILEPRLNHTHLDGAALLTPDGRPVIGLTLRHDRLDNFWFTLFHELGHVLKHLSPGNPAMVDCDIDELKTEQVEREADRFALDTLIPPDAWEHQVRHLHYAEDIRAAARQLCIDPAIIAGRLRREANDYRKHRTLIGSREVLAAFHIKPNDWLK